jgi:predicted ArsR family transcriptional regulator
VLERTARETGERLGAQARAVAGVDAGAAQTVADVLESQGFEPRAEAGVLVLGNCPFHALAEQHTALVCGMNLQLLDGLVEGLLGKSGATAEGAPPRVRLDPAPGRCCVVLEGDWSRP